jgi:hypothetical protein
MASDGRKAAGSKKHQPTSPAHESNFVENIWQFLRQNHLSNRVFESYTDIADACCAAWNAIVSKPKRFTSIAAGSAAPCVTYHAARHSIVPIWHLADRPARTDRGACARCRLPGHIAGTCGQRSAWRARRPCVELLIFLSGDPSRKVRMTAEDRRPDRTS